MMAHAKVPKQSRRKRRFFCQDKLIKSGQSVQLSSSESNHLRNVLRLKVGEFCLLTDGKGQLADAEITEITGQGLVVLKVKSLMDSDRSLDTLNLSIHLAIPQKGKFDYLVEKAQEMGLGVLAPMITSRTVVKIAKAQELKVLDRWQRIVEGAAKQSEALHLTRVEAPQKLQKSIDSIPKDETIVLFHPGSEAVSFNTWLMEFKKKQPESGPTHLFIGPEGGFTDDEIDLLIKRGAQQVQLGTQILKVDTAFLAVLGALRLTHER